MVTHHYTCRNCNKLSAVVSEDSSPFPLPLECPKCGQQNRLRFLHTTTGEVSADTQVAIDALNICAEALAVVDTATATLQSRGGASGGWPDNQGYDSGDSSGSSSND